MAIEGGGSGGGLNGSSGGRRRERIRRSAGMAADCSCSRWGPRSLLVAGVAAAATVATAGAFQRAPLPALPSAGAAAAARRPGLCGPSTRSVGQGSFLLRWQPPNSFRRRTTTRLLGPDPQSPGPPPTSRKNLVSSVLRRLEKADIGIVPTAAFLVQAALTGLFTGLSIITFKTLISVMETYTYGNFLTSALNAFGSGKPLSFAMVSQLCIITSSVSSQNIIPQLPTQPTQPTN